MELRDSVIERLEEAMMFAESENRYSVSIGYGCAEDILTLLKIQEPRLLTAEDFKERNDVDWSKALPAWVEYRRDGEWGEYWGDQQDEWAVVRKDMLNAEGFRCWTGYPSQKQRDEVKWDDNTANN